MGARQQLMVVVAVLALVCSACSSVDSAEGTEAGIESTEDTADRPEETSNPKTSAGTAGTGGGGTTEADADLDPDADRDRAASVDTDGAGPVDTDGDGHSDQAEGAGAVDTDGDGLTDDVDPDSDGDGLLDKDETEQGRVDSSAATCPSAGCKKTLPQTAADCQPSAQPSTDCGRGCDDDDESQSTSTTVRRNSDGGGNGDEEECACSSEEPKPIDGDCDSVAGDDIMAFGPCGRSVAPIGPGNHPGYAVARLAGASGDLSVGCGGFAPDTIEWDQFLKRVNSWASTLDITVIATDFQLVLIGPTAVLEQPAFGMTATVLGGRPQQEPPMAVTVDPAALQGFVGGDVAEAAPERAAELALDGSMFDQEQALRILVATPRQVLIDRAAIGGFDSDADRLTLAVAIDPDLLSDLRTADGLGSAVRVAELDGLESAVGALVDHMTVGRAVELGEGMGP